MSRTQYGAEVNKCQRVLGFDPQGRSQRFCRVIPAAKRVQCVAEVDVRRREPRTEPDRFAVCPLRVDEATLIEGQEAEAVPGLRE